jgi:Protein of unknown function (DUF1566)
MLIYYELQPCRVSKAIFKLKKYYMTENIKVFMACAIVFILSGCGSGNTSINAATDTVINTSQLNCTDAQSDVAGYGLVFKGCNGSAAEFYDKTECVKDYATGLIWEGKTTSGLRNYTNVYTNYDSTTALQKRNGSYYIVPTQAEINDGTNSVGFKNAVNASGLCGINNWRIPTKAELLSITKTSEYPTIANSWFPNTIDWAHWTSSSHPSDEGFAWLVGFYDGTANFNGLRSDYYYPIRLVSGN